MNRFGFNQKYLDNIINILKKDKNIKSAKIFGSRAIGDYNYNSDIDLAVYFEDNYIKSISTLLDLQDCAGIYTVDVVAMTEDLDKKFVKDVEKYGIEIYTK